MSIIYKLIFLVFATAGLLAIFFVSWFWSLLALPMVLVLAVDVFSSMFKKKKLN